MTEAAMKLTIKTILDTHMSNKYDLKIVGRKRESVSMFIVTAAVICKEDFVTQELMEDFVDHSIQNDDSVELSETRIELSDLNFEVLLLEAEVTYYKA